MASGYRINGYDFDDLFDPDVMGDGPTASGYRRSGQPLRYAHIQYGQKRGDVGYRSGGVDVSNLWAAKGTATYVLPFHGKGFSAHNQSDTNAQGNTSAQVELRINADGAYEVWVSTIGGGNNSSRVAERGLWLRNGGVGEYDVRFEFANVGAANVGSTAPDWRNASASQSCSAQVSVPSASGQNVRADVEFHCLMRRAGGNVSRSIMVASVGAAGWW